MTKPVAGKYQWSLVDPISKEDLATLVHALERPGGLITWPKADIAALVVRMRQAEGAR